MNLDFSSGPLRAQDVNNSSNQHSVDWFVVSNICSVMTCFCAITLLLQTSYWQLLISSAADWVCVNHLLSYCLVEGLIRLRSSPPPHLQGVEYVLNVTATDDNASGGPQALSSTAQVIVGVDDVNNNKPVFEKVRRAVALSHH